MSKLKITTKIVLAFVGVLLLVALIGGYSIIKMNEMADTTTKMYRHPFTVSNAVKDVRTKIVEIHREMKDISVATSASKISSSVAVVNDLEASALESFDIIYDRFLGNKKMVDDAYNAFVEWKKIRDEVIQLTMDGKKSEANAITREKGADKVAEINGYVNALNDFAQDKAIEFFNTSERVSNNNIIMAVILMVVAIVLGAGTAVLLTLNISSSFRVINKRMAELAEGEGDLSRRLDFKGTDELGTLAASFNTFIGKIQSLVTLVKDNVETLLDSSMRIEGIMGNSNKNLSEIAISFGQVSEVSQNTASIAQESNSSIEEIASNSEIVSRDSDEIFDEVKNVLNIAKDGAKSIQEVVETNDFVKDASTQTMNNIHSLKESTDQIEDILDIITGISEQTNLLALNASIEAARAGEAGRGFAVVADEIRKLAEESRNSSEQIGLLIKEIQNRTNEANNSVTSSSELTLTSIEKSKVVDEQFSLILDLIEGVSERVKNITMAARQQADITSDMTEGIDALALDAQNNASAVQQINASIEEQVSSFEIINQQIGDLNNISERLKRETDKFECVK